MLNQFRTYTLAVEFHRCCQRYPFPGYLKQQLLRASSSVALNLSEGSTRESPKEQKRFYLIALGSGRECQTALVLAPHQYPELIQKSDVLGGHLYRLVYPRSKE